MSSLLTPTAASSIVIVDELGAASLTDIARIAEKAVSTVQRSVSSLAAANVLRREWNRGPYTFAPTAPRAALRELAEWTLGHPATQKVVTTIHSSVPAEDSGAPATITNPKIRRAWPHAIRRIVSNYHPKQVVLFGSQSRGDAQPDSDVDLLVVFDRVPDRRERGIELMRLLSDMPFAKDVLVVGAKDTIHPLRGSALADALKNGVVVYER